MTTDTSIIVCKLADLPAGEMRLVEAGGRKIGVFHGADGGFYAIEDRCSHDDGPLAEGEFDPASCTVECPRHGSLFDLRTGKPQDPSGISTGRDLRGPRRSGRSEVGALILR